MKMQFKLAALSMAMALSSGAQADVVVDLFQGNQGFDTVNGVPLAAYTDGTADATDTGLILNGTPPQGGAYTSLLGDILGNEREIWVSKISGNSATSAYTNASGFNLDNGTLTQGRGQVQWDGTANSDKTIDATGLGGADLTALGTLDSFEVITNYSDGGFTFEISAYTDASNWTKLTLQGQQHLGPLPFTNFISFAAFALPDNTGACPDGVNPIPTNPPSSCYPDGQGGFVRVQQTGSGVNLANLGALVLDINRYGNASVVSLDVSLRSIKAVPEPGVLALMGIGLLGLSAAARRSRRKA